MARRPRTSSRFPTWLRLVITASIVILGYYLGRDRIIDPVPQPPSRPTRPTPPSAPTAAGPIYRDAIAFGAPVASDDRPSVLIRRPQYTVSYNTKLNVANWVAWNLNASQFGDAPRSSSFTTDPLLPDGAERIVSSDYTGSGYDRGHMVRSEERTRTPAENKTTFYLSNVLPQTHDLNAGPWLNLELFCQSLAQHENRDLYIVAGGMFGSRPKRLNGKVAVPSATWKVIVSLPAGRGLADVHSAGDLRVIAALMPNQTGLLKRPWTDFQTTVDEIERQTGLDLLPTLPDEIERVVEATKG